MCTSKVKNPGDVLTGTVFQLTGTMHRNGKFGNLYEVTARGVIFNSWNHAGLVLGEWRYGFEPKLTMEGNSWVEGNYICTHKYLLISLDHEHWGLFIPDGTPTACVERSLAWYQEYGEQPVIDADDPDSYHWETVVKNGYEIDALRKVRHS